MILKRMALCAAHDAIGLRHSIRDFKLYVKEQAKWSKITEHNPALMNGVSGESKPCFPLPAKPYPDPFSPPVSTSNQRPARSSAPSWCKPHAPSRGFPGRAGIATGRVPEL